MFHRLYTFNEDVRADQAKAKSCQVSINYNDRSIHKYLPVNLSGTSFIGNLDLILKQIKSIGTENLTDRRKSNIGAMSQSECAEAIRPENQRMGLICSVDRHFRIYRLNGSVLGSEEPVLGYNEIEYCIRDIKNATSLMVCQGFQDRNEKVYNLRPHFIFRVNSEFSPSYKYYPKSSKYFKSLHREWGFNSFEACYGFIREQTQNILRIKQY